MEDKKSSSGLSIGVIILVIFLGIGFVIGLTQVSGRLASNNSPTTTTTTTIENQYSDFIFDENGKLLYCTNTTDGEITIPDTYSLTPYKVKQTMTFNSFDRLNRFMQYSNIKQFTCENQSVSEYYEWYGWHNETKYVITFEAPAAIEGNDIKTTEIAEYAFRNNNYIRKVILPSDLKTIGQFAFCECYNLQEVVFNDKLEKISQYVFQNCNQLRKAILPDSVKTLEYGAFMSCYQLTEVRISPNIKNFGACAFFDCWQLTSVEIPEGVERINSQAFHHCNNLREVHIASSVNYINSDAFRGLAPNANIYIAGRTPFSISTNAFEMGSSTIYVANDVLDLFLNNSNWNRYTIVGI